MWFSSIIWCLLRLIQSPFNYSNITLILTRQWSLFGVLHTNGACHKYNDKNRCQFLHSLHFRNSSNVYKSKLLKNKISSKLQTKYKHACLIAFASLQSNCIDLTLFQGDCNAVQPGTVFSCQQAAGGHSRGPRACPPVVR